MPWAPGLQGLLSDEDSRSVSPAPAFFWPWDQEIQPPNLEPPPGGWMLRGCLTVSARCRSPCPVTRSQSFLPHVTVTQPSFLTCSYFWNLDSSISTSTSQCRSPELALGWRATAHSYRGFRCAGRWAAFAPSVHTTTLCCCSVTPSSQTRRQTISRPVSSVPPVCSFPDNLKDVPKHPSDQVPVLPQALPGFLLALWVQRERCGHARLSPRALAPAHLSGLISC